MKQHDVERIVRDVVYAQGWDISIVSVEPIADGWRVTITNVVSAASSIEIPSGSPAAIRTAVGHWLDSQV